MALNRSMSMPHTPEKHATNRRLWIKAEPIRYHGIIVQPSVASTLALIGKVL
jgi:hypothetical protein